MVPGSQWVPAVTAKVRRDRVDLFLATTRTAFVLREVASVEEIIFWFLFVSGRELRAKSLRWPPSENPGQPISRLPP